MVKLPSLSITGTSLDTEKQEVVVEGIAAEQCAVLIKRLASGDLSVQAITPPKTAAEQPVPSEKSSPAWVTTVKKPTLQKFSFQGEHLTAEEDSNLTIDEIMLTADDFSTKPGAKGNIDFSCRVNNSGTIAAKGACGIAPVAAALNLDVKEINMAGFQPFLAGVMNARLASGSLSTSGTLSAVAGKGDHGHKICRQFGNRQLCPRWKGKRLPIF